LLRPKWIACAAVIGLAVALDQAVKALVVWLLPVGEQVTVLPGVLVLAQVRQAGAALGLLDSLDPVWLPRALGALGGVAVLLLGQLLWRAPGNDVLSGTGVGLIAGGAIANLVDRLRFAEVIEFVQLDLRLFRLPDFNLADCAIAAGMALLLLDLVASEGVRREPH
jgi:signal peptidase II